MTLFLALIGLRRQLDLPPKNGAPLEGTPLRVIALADERTEILGRYLRQDAAQPRMCERFEAVRDARRI